MGIVKYIGFIALLFFVLIESPDGKTIQEDNWVSSAWASSLDLLLHIKFIVQLWLKSYWSVNKKYEHNPSSNGCIVMVDWVMYEKYSHIKSSLRNISYD